MVDDRELDCRILWLLQRRDAGRGVVLAGLFAWRKRGTPQFGLAEQLLRWVLLLSVGVQGVYTFILHVFFPAYSAKHIGWAVSPF